MKKRSRAHEAGSIEAGSSISKSIFFANRVDRAVVGSQIEPAGAPRSAQSSQIEPARAAGAARSSQTRPNRASKGARGSQSEPIEARSSQQGRPGRARGAQAAPAGRPAEARESQDRSPSSQIKATKATSTKHCPCAAKSSFRCTGPRFSSSQIQPAGRPGAHRVVKLSQPGRPRARRAADRGSRGAKRERPTASDPLRAGARSFAQIPSS